ncbi:hypothetical protein BGZ51_007094 [Haplosporangium sp. Z 767]|nr:hypothetical protein BGZ51_007094 [Haplosporangium sp. Z 767]KAF9196516.1 hypothetical protein BGZ50_009517 [Haplosporangium sp. Z 11]
MSHQAETTDTTIKMTAPLSGSIHHLSLSVTDMEKSIKFYRFLCIEILGFAELEASKEHAMWYKYGATAIGISPGTKVSHHKFNPGLHHWAFNLDSRAQVDGAHKKIEEFYNTNSGEKLGHILDAPAEYDYMPGYYAAFFTDPDGMKIELVHTPLEAYL